MMREAVVVTGAGGALGSALVAHLAGTGSYVVAVGRGLTQAKADAAYGADRVRAAAFELGSAADWSALVERLDRDGVAPTGAVLAAGGFRGGERLHEERDDSVWRAMFEANLETVRATLRALVPGMVARRRGSIVVVGSRAAVSPDTSVKAAAYAASKAAAVALAQTVAAEVAADGVRVNAVLPSTLDTPANRAAMPKADFGRWVKPASLAAVVAFLLSEAARDVSGALLPVYGQA